MTPEVTILAATLSASAGATVTYLVARLKASGSIATSEAAQLWQESARMREEMRTRVKDLEGRIDETERRNAFLREQNEELAKANEDMREQTEQLLASNAALTTNLRDLQDTNRVLLEKLREATKNGERPNGQPAV